MKIMAVGNIIDVEVEEGDTLETALNRAGLSFSETAVYRTVSSVLMKKSVVQDSDVVVMAESEDNG